MKQTTHCSDFTISRFDFGNRQLFHKAVKLRIKVFVKEQGVHMDDELDGEDALAYHYLLMHNDKSIATCRLRHTPEGLKIERMAVRKSWRKQGIGHCLMKKLLKDLGKSKDNLYLYAQKDAVGFYRKFGFRPVGKLFKDAGIDHYKMIFQQ